METLEQTLRHTHGWILDRVELLNEEKEYDDAFSIVQEFEEWLDPDEGLPSDKIHDIYSLEYLGDPSDH